ncbi:MAG TPA: hypothetical protein VG900_09685 [Hyphomicrobiaceae bacterium]|jgi:hypothetical protein|nr:hypothetical protein [Hyphomicrobiaceae bacterium]
MSFEDKEAELGILLTRIQNEPEDWHELYEQLRLRLNELKAYGMPLPQDLVEFERDLEAEMEARQESYRRHARMREVATRRARR